MARVALVTGGTRGIGHAISVALKNAGYRVAASYAGNDAAAQQFQVETGIPVYFADPHSPWQRGTNENTNGLLRQYFPKGTDLSRWSAEEIAAVAAALNSRPRKSLGWKTPAEALDEHLRSLAQAAVATTG